MILADANLLLYAYNPASEHHARARDWLEAALSGDEIVGFPWLSLLAFLRLSTSPRIFPEPLTTTDATEIVSGWLARRKAVIIEPTDRHWGILRPMLLEGRIRAAGIMDAHLAAIAVEHGATLFTSDRDFARFPGLKLLDPLEA